MIRTENPNWQARTKLLLLLPVLALAACGGKASDADTSSNPVDEAVTAELPPSIKRTTSYRCEDNSVLSVDFLDDDLTINLRTEGSITQLKADTLGASSLGDIYKADGFTLLVDGNAINLSRTGTKPLRCKS